METSSPSPPPAVGADHARSKRLVRHRAPLWKPLSAIKVDVALRRLKPYANDGCFNVPDALYAVQQITATPLTARAANLPSIVSASWHQVAGVNRVLYSKNVPTATQILGIYHELGHMVLGHGADTGERHSQLEALTPSISPELAARLMRARSPGLVQVPEEWEAERFARKLFRWSLRLMIEFSSTDLDNAFGLARPGGDLPW